MKRSECEQLEARHRPSGLNTEFTGLSFAGYVAASRSMLARVHAADHEKIVEGNAPFELHPNKDYPTGQSKPYKRGILLTHGLTDSPYFMRHLARFFVDQGFRVMAILLPGHGTQPGDMLNARWREWAATLAYGVEQLSFEVDEIYLAGYSTGGSLSVYHSLTDERICGLFLYSPAFKVSYKAAFANWHKLYSWLIPSAKWLTLCPDRDIYKYESVTKQAVAEAYALTRQLHKALQKKRIRIPVFIAASFEDTTVCTSAMLDFIANAEHPASHMLLYSADTKTPVPDKVEVVNSMMPEQRILSFSHISILIPDTDVHYGIKGAYCNCLHYYSDEMEKYLTCVTHPEQAMLGETTPANLSSCLLCRLTYNPKLAALETAMQRFLESLP